MKSAIGTILSVIGATALIATVAPRTSGQVNDADLEQRVFNLGLLRKGKSTAKSATKRVDPKIILAQVQDDFTRVQVIDNDLAEVIERRGTLDLEFVAKSVSEIHTRANRLLENLTESKAKKSNRPIAEPIADRPQLKESLVMLDKLIVDFTHNPVFKEASVDDDKLAAKALRDLDQIIELSARVVKGVENLIKPSQQSP